LPSMRTAVIGSGRAKPSWVTSASWTLRILISVAFIVLGGAKWSDSPPAVHLYDSLGVHSGLRYALGYLELAGAIAILVSGLGGSAAILLGAIAAATVSVQWLYGMKAAIYLVLTIACVLTAYLEYRKG
jgi:putative oxidoreductase